MGPNPQEPSNPPRQDLTPDELRALLEQHTIQPVQGAPGKEALATTDPEIERAMSGQELPAAKFALPSDPAAAPQAPAPPPAATPAERAAAAPEEATVLAPEPAPEQGPLPASQPRAEPEVQLDPKPTAAPTPEPPRRFEAVPSDENPYIRFGERIKVNPDGTITKPFPLRAGTGQNLLDLIKSYGNFPIWIEANGPGPSPPNMVKLDLLPGWDLEIAQDLRAVPQVAGQPVQLADWLVVTAGADLLQEVEDFINLFAASVPQIEIEAKVVEVVLTDAWSLGVRPVGDQPIFDFPDGTFVDSFTYNLPNGAGLINSALMLSSIQDGFAFNAVLEAIAGRQNVSIINQPKIAVREGGRAEINATTKLPYLNVSGINQAGGYTASVAFVDVGVKLYVIPRVVGTQTVALNIDIEASQQTGQTTTLIEPNGGQVTYPEISIRGARTTVYLQPGQAVILGGLISERNFEEVNKVPVLGDIPIVKYLFSSTSTGKRQTNVLFFIRPRILQGIDLHRAF